MVLAVLWEALLPMRTGAICGDTKRDTRIERCYTDGDALVSWDHQGTVDTHSATSVDAASLGSGEICFALNDGINNPDPAWFQNINKGADFATPHAQRENDKNPVLSGDHALVYERNGIYTNDVLDIARLGKGTRQEPYKVATAEDLQDVILSIGVMKRSDFYVLQTADIDMKDTVTIVPIGTCTDGFEGHYDGGGHVIRNMKMQHYQGESLGLFNNIKGVVENLGIETGTFKATDRITRVGAFAGRMTAGGLLRNCFARECMVDYNRLADTAVGALVGEQADASHIESCYGYRNTVVGRDGGKKHYGYIVGYIGSNATDSLVYTDGPSLCADGQPGAQNMQQCEAGVADIRFKTGELCYLLSGSKSYDTPWGQTIRQDSVPVLTSKLVYRHVNEQQVMYTNSRDLPEFVSLTLHANDDNDNIKMVQAFRADDFATPHSQGENYYTPAFKLEPYAFERDYYYMKGWNTQKDGRGTFYPYDGELLSADNLALYAMWDMTVPADGETNEVTLEAEPVSYKVYDGGGSAKPYGKDYDGKLALKAPEGYFFCLTGTVSTEALGSDEEPCDYMTVYDGGKNSDVKLTNEHAKSVSSYEDIFYSTTDGAREDIGVLMSTGNEMTIEFVSNDEYCFDGLDLTVSVLPKNIRQIGQGTKEDPFKVASADDLRAVGLYIQLAGDSKVYVRQTADIDMKGDSFTPLASTVESFEGFYDGGGHTIRNMTMNAAGLFSNVSGIVEHLGMVNCTVDGAADNSVVGIIAGRLSGNGQVRNCYAVGNSVSFVGQDKVFTMGAEYTAERFASGEVSYLLNGEMSDSSVVWHQTLGTDSLPVFNDSHGIVYRYLRNDQTAYSNTPVSAPRYYISNEEDFLAFINKEGDMYLTQDIDLGYITTHFVLAGNFDGGGHTITYKSQDGSQGLFALIRQGASVKHLQVEANIVSSNGCGGIAFTNYGTMSDCHFHGNIHCNSISGRAIAGIGLNVSGNGTIDHCSATGSLTVQCKDGLVYPITKDTDRATNCTWVDPNDQSQYAAQRDSALNAQAEYPVYAKGILDATRPRIVVGNDTIVVDDKHIPSLTIVDGERFSCPAEVTVDEITYKRRGTKGAYEPWVLPCDYTIDASMIFDNVEFYRFEKDSTGNIQVIQINGNATYQVSANEPLAFRTSNETEYCFQIKLKKDGSALPTTIKMPADGVAVSMASRKDIAQVMVTYDSIAAEKTVKDLMYIWDNDKGDFVLGDGKTGLQPFRYYLQYVDKATGNIEEYEQTDWARKAARDHAASQQAHLQVKQRAALSTMIAQGWQPIILDLRESQTITAKMLEDYDILCLSDLYDQEADDCRYAVSVIYEPVEEITLPYAVPLLVRAKCADVEPLVTEQMGREIEALLTEAAEQMTEDEIFDAFEELHYWCSTFTGRYDVWQFVMPEKDDLLNEYGALVFGDTGFATPHSQGENDQYFYRVAASDGYTMTPMSYCFTAYDARTFENLPLANDRIEIVVLGQEPPLPTGIEDVRGERADVRGDAYNLQGQKVGDSYRGLVIQNGSKIFKR